MGVYRVFGGLPGSGSIGFSFGFLGVEAGSSWLSGAIDWGLGAWSFRGLRLCWGGVGAGMLRFVDTKIRSVWACRGRKPETHKHSERLGVLFLASAPEDTW